MFGNSKNIRNIQQDTLYHLVRFIFSFATTMVFTINILYHIQGAKLAPWQLIIVGMCLEVTCFLFEIPTGIIADRYSRKLSVILGFVLIGIGFIVEGSFPYFITIAIAQVIWGCGFTCVSGALDAWVIDETGKEEIYISGSKYATIGQFLGIIGSVVLAQVTLKLPIVVGGILLVGLGGGLVFLMTEKPYKKNTESIEGNYFVEAIKSIFQTIKVSHVLMMLFIITFIFGLYSEGFDRLWGAYILQTETFMNANATYLFGGVSAVIACIGFFIFDKIEACAEHTSIKRVNSSLILLCCIVTGSLFVMSVTKNAYTLIVLVIIINLSRSIIEPFETIWFNQLITDSSTRASILSLRGQMGAFGQIGSGMLMGVFSVVFPMRFIFALSAIIFSPVIFMYRYLKSTNKK